MKLIIDIDKKLKSEVYRCGVFLSPTEKMSLIEAINNGTPIPDNATNGEVLKIMFKPNRITRTDDVVREEYEFNEVWWNASYQKGGTNRKNCEYRHENGNCLKVGGFCTSVDDEHCVKGGKE